MRETLEHLMEQACNELGYDSTIAEKIKEPYKQYEYDLGDGAVAARTIHRGVPLERGEDTVEYLSQGGCRVEVFTDRVRPNVSEAVYKSSSLAANQTLKNILGDLPLGGAKADIFVPEKVFDDPEAFRAVLGSFVRRHAEVILGGDGIGPDMNLGPEDMDHMAETLVSISKHPGDGARITGKSVEHQGVKGRADATSRGMLKAIELFAQAEEWPLEGTTVAIEGSGNVGYHFARLAHQAGAKIMGMSDVHRTVLVHNINGPGLEPDQDIKFKDRDIAWYDEELAGSRNNPGDLHQAEVDLFVFAGPSGSVTAAKGNIGRVVARRRLFGANTPEDWHALEYDKEHDYINYPDIAVNIGGVIGSFVERTTGERATEADVHAQIDSRIQRAVELILVKSREPSDYVQVANREAVRRLHARDNHLIAV